MKRKKNIIWLVWIWDFNHDRLEEYDVMPYFLEEYKALKKKDRPVDLEELSEWLDNAASYRFWAKCEYEMIVHSWPELKNDMKVDVYDQLRLNWDVFVKFFYDEVVSKKGKKA